MKSTVNLAFTIRLLMPSFKLDKNMLSSRLVAEIVIAVAVRSVI